ncbi:MAG TPA: hypothetical protein VMT99_02560 [Candidatus Paceibacterota bacterium]|nr:hypothetical protein [Candidatus Paceibacterota bacterium]
MKNVLIAIAVAVMTSGILPGAGAAVAHAAPDLTVTPAVIDAHGLPHDISDYSLTVTNVTDHQVNVFASVYELTADGSQPFTDPSTSDRPALLADWISVTRGAMIFAPGESKTVPVEINVNPYATAGDYHAVIAFVEGSTRDEAEQHLTGAPQTLVNFTVASDAKEDLQLVQFGPEKRFSSGFPVVISYQIRNDGTVVTTPAGSVIFYDNIGHELGSVPANPSGVAIAPGDTKTFTARWDGGGSGMGEYKASLEATYGARDAQLADTALVWVMPWQKLLALFAGLLALVIIVAVALHRSYLKRHHRRKSVIAHLMKRRDVVDLRGPRDAEPPRPPYAHRTSRTRTRI